MTTTGSAAVEAAEQLVRWQERAAEIDRLNRADPRAAFSVAEAWLASERAGGSAEGYARALRSHAHALRFLGRYEQALAEYEEAERRFRALDLETEAARTQVGHAGALRYTGRYAESIALAERTRAYFLAQGDDLQAAKQANNLGTVYRAVGRLQDALRMYREARAVFRRLGERSSLADVEQNTGNVLVDLGRYEDAIVSLRAAERIRRLLGLEAEVARTLLNIGILSYRRGDYGRALQALSEARRIDEALGIDRGVKLVDLQLLPTSVALNLREESAAAAERAIRGMRELGMPFELGQALFAAAGLAESNGDVALARQRIDEAREIFERMGNRVWEAVTRLHQARLAALGADAGGAVEADAVMEARADDAASPNGVSTLADEAPADGGPLAGREPAHGEHLDGTADTSDRAAASAEPTDVLRRALAECQAAIRQLEEAGAVDRAVIGRLVEGSIWRKLGAPNEALARYEQALATATDLRADHLLFRAHAAVGELVESARPDAAIDSYRRAIDHLEAVRARALADDLKLSFLADKADLYERVVGLLLRDAGAEPPEAVTEAYRYVERSKSRTLLEELLASDGTAARGRRSRLEKLTRRVRDIRTRLNHAYSVAYAADATPSADTMTRSGQHSQIAALEQEFASATRELQLAVRAERNVVVAMDSGDLGELRLPSGVVLVEFYTVADDLLAFIRTGDAIVLRRLGSVDDVVRLVDRLGFQINKIALGTEYLRANMDMLRRGMDRVLHQLWQAIVAPLEPDLAGHCQVVVVPHGPLHGLPFHAFHDGSGYLDERLTVTYAPSAGVYQACLRTTRSLGDRLVVAGVDDPGLPWVAHEIGAVVAAWPSAQVLAGAKATRRALERRAGTFDALHLATHGVFREDNPTFSSVKLADAWLTVADLAEIARGAQLVTLSACETGVGGVTVGDEVLGLTRGLLGAGCSTVVASLWTVSDESTASLMALFYAEIRKGAEPGSALRAATLQLRKEYDHPLYWAPFVVVGGGGLRLAARD